MIVTTEYIGNQELLKLQKTAFLASSNIATETVLQVYDWATEMRSRGDCIISGFNSKLEQDVLHFLLKGDQPIILVLARRMYKVIPKELHEALIQKRLLIREFGIRKGLKKLVISSKIRIFIGENQ